MNAPERPSNPAQARWFVALLGGFSLQGELHHYHHLPSRAVTALLARLALWPERTHAREALVELLWPGVDMAAGRNRLRQALFTLRGLLDIPGQPEALIADRTGVRLSPGALACDVLAFEQAVRAGRAAEATRLYRGELLPGFYDEWIQEERMRLAALAERVPLAATAGPVEPVPNAALEVAASAAPAYVTRLFGADDALHSLGQDVFTQRLVTLLGPGGSGKTRLAVELVHRLQSRLATPQADAGFDLITFVPLASCNDTTGLLDTLQTALRVRGNNGSAVTRLARALGGKRVLLVLDNLEQLLPQAAEVVAGLATALPQLHLLITSRRLLGVPGEREVHVMPLHTPLADASLAQAATSPALALFVDRASAARAGFELNERNAPLLGELVRVLQGMPLAIELAASRVRSIAPAEILQRLQSGGVAALEVLTRSGMGGDIDPRHASMTRVIAWSWQQLAPSAAHKLAALAVFDAGFSSAAAAAVCGDGVNAHSTAHLTDTAALLEELQAHSMLQSHEQRDGSLRFALYEPIREYAATQLGADEATALRKKLRAWWIRWAASFGPTPPLPAVRAEMPNLVAALHNAVADGVPSDALHLALALRPALTDVALPAAGLAPLEAALAACTDFTDREIVARSHTLLGVLSFEAGLRDVALAHVQQGLALAAAGSPHRARALHALARVRWRSTHRAEGLGVLLDEAMALALAGGEIEIQASVFALRGFISNVQDSDFGRGEALHRQALALWEQLGNEPAINGGIYNLAVCAVNARRFGEALMRLDAVCAAAREHEDWHQLSQALNLHGNALAGLREWPAALRAYRESAAVAWSIGDPHALAYALWNAPPVLAHLRRADEAAKLMGFVARYWEQRFGPLAPSDLSELKRAERLVRVQIGLERLQTQREIGARLDVAQARALLREA